MVLLMLGIIGANAAEDVTTIDDSAIAKNQTEDIEESDFADVSNLTADQGNWTVGECIIVKMATQVIFLVITKKFLIFLTESGYP